jgi:hypothetical protein
LLCAVPLAAGLLVGLPALAEPPFAEPPPDDPFAQPPPDPPPPVEPVVELPPPPPPPLPVPVLQPQVVYEPVGLRLERSGLLVPSSLEARELGRFTLSARGGVLSRADSSGRLAAAGTFELGVEVLPRLTVGAAYMPTRAALDSSGAVPLQGHTVLGQLRYAVGRWGSPGLWMAQIQVAVGGGLYILQEPTLGGPMAASSAGTGASASVGAVPSTQQLGPGLRTGLDASIYYRRVGLVLGYGFHYAPLREAAPGGLKDAGGHEVSVGLALRL